MATLCCRECGAQIHSDTRRTRCTCGALFPLQCVVCEKPLRPPLPVYPDERHLTPQNEPLCEEHYERQCPDCGSWFRADENPGYFRCASCAEAYASGAHPAAEPAPTFAPAATASASTLVAAPDFEEDASQTRAKSQANAKGCSSGATLFVTAIYGGYHVARVVLHL